MSDYFIEPFDKIDLQSAALYKGYKNFDGRIRSNNVLPTKNICSKQ